MNSPKPYAVSKPYLKLINWFLALIGLFWVGFIGQFYIAWLPIFTEEVYSFVFTPVEATISSCSVVAETNADTGYASRRIIRYNYIVDGLAYEGDRYYTSRRAFERAERSNRGCDNFQAGKKITAFVSPFNAQNAILNRGVQPRTWYTFLALAPFALFAFAVGRSIYISLIGLRKNELMRDLFLYRSSINQCRVVFIEMGSWGWGLLAFGIFALVSTLISNAVDKIDTTFAIEAWLLVVCSVAMLVAWRVAIYRQRIGKESWIFDGVQGTLVKGDVSVTIRCADIAEVQCIQSQTLPDSEYRVTYSYVVILKMNDGAIVKFYEQGGNLEGERARLDGEFLKHWLTRELVACRRNSLIT